MQLPSELRSYVGHIDEDEPTPLYAEENAHRVVDLNEDGLVLIDDHLFTDSLEKLPSELSNYCGLSSPGHDESLILLAENGLLVQNKDNEHKYWVYTVNEVLNTPTDSLWSNPTFMKVSSNGNFLAGTAINANTGETHAVLLMQVEITAEDTDGNNVAANPDGVFVPKVGSTTPDLVPIVPGNLDFATQPESEVFKNALVIYYNDVLNQEGELKNFDIKLNLPSGLPNVQWQLVEGPEGSGTLLNANQAEAIFRNPTKGGLYKFDFTINGQMRTRVQVWLPLAGPDISPYIQDQIDYFRNQWGPNFRSNLESYFNDFTGRTAIGRMMVLTMGTASIKYVGNDLDFNGYPMGTISPSDFANIGGNGLVLADVNRMTIHGHVTVWNERNNMMYALIGREMGVPESILKYGPNASQIPVIGGTMGGGAVGQTDDEYTFEAYEAGFYLHDGESLKDVMDNRARKIQRPGSYAERIWPSDEVTEEELQLLQAAQDKLNELLGPNINNIIDN